MAWTKPYKCTECDEEFSDFRNFYPEKTKQKMNMCKQTFSENCNSPLPQSF